MQKSKYMRAYTLSVHEKVAIAELFHPHCNLQTLPYHAVAMGCLHSVEWNSAME